MEGLQGFEGAAGRGGGGGGPEDLRGRRCGELGGGRLVLGQAGRLWHVGIRLCVHLMCRDEAGAYIKVAGPRAMQIKSITSECGPSHPSKLPGPCPAPASRPLPSPSQQAPAPRRTPN